MRRGLLWWLALVAGGVVLLALLVGLFVLPEEYRFGTDVVIATTPDRAWTWFINPARWPKRFSTVQSVEGAPGTMAGVGTHHRVTLNLPGGGTLASDLVVTDAVAGQLYADRHLGDWLNGRLLPVTNVTDRLEFKPDGEGRTRIAFMERLDVNGPLNKWLAYLVLKPIADRVIAEVAGESLRAVGPGRPVSPVPAPAPRA
jgi:hypothetical protein